MRALLLRRGVPGTTAPTCPCGLGDQAAAHLFTEHADARSQGTRSVGFYTKEDVWEGLGDSERAPAMARATVNSGCLPQLSVFSELRQQDETTAARESAWARRPKRGPAIYVHTYIQYVKPPGPSHRAIAAGGFYPAQGRSPWLESTRERHRMLSQQPAVPSIIIYRLVECVYLNTSFRVKYFKVKNWCFLGTWGKKKKKKDGVEKRKKKSNVRGLIG